MAKQKVKEGDSKPLLSITYYTDPLCCWSWGLDQHLTNILLDFENQISIRYCMGGLISDWSGYNDEVNSVNRPVQMGPMWMYAQQMCNVPMKSTIWYTDPPSSSYPPCIAVKCAELQSSKSAEIYLKFLRQGLMTEGLNISRETVLFDLAKRLAKIKSINFDLKAFHNAYTNGDGIESFRKDMNEIRTNNITRFPTMVIRNAEKGIILTGYRPFDALRDAVNSMLDKKLAEV